MIEGAFSTATCFATNIEPEAVEQIRAMCDQPFTEGERVAIMPDAHAGKGCTIGTTMTVTNKAVPNVVGVDIGCGMYTVDIGRAHIDLPNLDEACHAIPSGFGVWDGRRERFDLTKLRCYRALRDTRRLERSLGTLGGGNHFVEVDVASDGTQYLVIHSGSRYLGVQTANYYQKLGWQAMNRVSDEARQALIERYKAEGRQSEIDEALRQLSGAFRSQEEIPERFAYVEGKNLEDYIHDMRLVQRFAELNRQAMAETIVQSMGLRVRDQFTTIHNYIETEHRILRKGSVSAQKGEKLLIPINMRDGALICVGKGNPEWNCSAPHGAGRLLSRSAAQSTRSMEQFRREMTGIYTTCVAEGTLDESPMAYKGLDAILSQIGPTAEVVRRIKPVYNYKAG